MTRKISLTILLTVCTVGVAIVFEVIHRQVDREVYPVPEKYLAPINTELRSDFIDRLKERQLNYLGNDLGY